MSKPHQEAPSQIQLEAFALRHVFNLAAEDRPEAAEKVDAAALELPGLVAAVTRELSKGPLLEPSDVAAMLERGHLEDERSRLETAGLADFLSRSLDPAEARRTFEACIAGAERKSNAKRIQTARRLLDQADGLEGPGLADALADVARVLEKPSQTLEDSRLENWWADFQGSLNPNPATPQEAIMLDPDKRGPWAEWFNAHLGDRGGLEPGCNLFIGGSWGAGKTSLGAALAVDALAAGCPVLFWQLELSPNKTLEHLVAQYPGEGAWWTRPFKERALAMPQEAPPGSWGRLLQVPRKPSDEATEIQAAIEKLARQTRRERGAGSVSHECNGLVLVDYVQRLTLKEKASRSEHEILSSAASKLAQTAQDCGVCLVMLSQLNKDAQRVSETGGTALAGADLARVADALLFIRKAKRKDGGGWTVATDGEPLSSEQGKGEPRLLTWRKTRGTLGTPPEEETIWTWNRALHGEDSGGLSAIEQGVF